MGTTIELFMAQSRFFVTHSRNLDKFVFLGDKALNLKTFFFSAGQWWRMPVIPALWEAEAEAGGFLSSRPAWSTE